MADTKNYTFIQVLKLHHAQLWETRVNQPKLLYKGDLQVLYSHSLDLLVLKMKDHTWLLDKSTQVIGTLSQDQGWISYSLSTPGGFFTLKLTDIDRQYGPNNAFLNFETILENTCTFNRSAALVESVGNYKEEEPTGDFGKVKEGVMNALHDLKEKLTHTEPDELPNHKLKLGFKELLNVETPAYPMVDLSADDLQLLKNETSLVVRDHQGLGDWKSLWEGKKPEHSVASDFGKLNISSEAKSGQSVPPQQGSKSESISEKQIPTEQPEYKTASKGTHHHDGQEVLGSENQRLPSYEVHHTSEHIEKGFEKASSHVFEGETSPKDLQRAESNEFTTGLLKNNLSSETSNPKTPYHKNEQPGVPDLQSGQVKTDLPKDALSLDKGQSWGSNVTNASETTPSLDTDLVGKLPKSKGNPSPTKINPGDTRTSLVKVAEDSENLKDLPAA